MAKELPAILTSFGFIAEHRGFAGNTFKKSPQILEPLEEVVTQKNEPDNGHQNTLTGPSEFFEEGHHLCPVANIQPSHKLQLSQSSFWSYENLIFHIFQMPVYALLVPFKFFIGLYNTTFGYSLPKEKDVLNLLFNSTMILFVKPCKTDDQTFILDCDFDPEREQLSGGLKSMKMTFKMRNGRVNVGQGKITEFVIDGVETKDPHKMMAALVYFIWGYSHPKIHSVADVLIRKIESDSITELRPSTYATRALHRLLLSSWFSALNPFMLHYFPMSKQRVVESSENFKDFHHTGIHLFKDAPFCQFLLQARSSCRKHLHGIGLGPEFCEYFFLHTIVHSLEHYCANKFSAFRFSLDPNSKGWWGCFRTVCFRMALSPVINPFRSNLMSSFPSDTIYGKIYSDLVLIDEGLANTINATMIN